jgi:copper chaperone CopZ
MTNYDITGMKCDGCATKVSDAFSAVPGVTSAHVDLASNTASVDGTYDEQALLDSLKDTHYSATPAK